MTEAMKMNPQKLKRSLDAHKHVKFCAEHFDLEIKHSGKNAKINAGFYPTHLIEEDLGIKADKNTIVTLEQMDSVSAVIKAREENKDDKICLLDFASYKNPGGGFLDGAMAQEEAVCGMSTLYNVLNDYCMKFYEENRKELNGGMYTNNYIYLDDIVFFKSPVDTKDREKNTVNADVLVMAAPNRQSNRIKYKMSGKKNKWKNPRTYRIYSENENVIDETLKDRIESVLNVAVVQKVDTLILGAFGCGVFGNDGETVADMFMELLETDYSGFFKKVIFAVPMDRTGNYDKFLRVYKRYTFNTKNE